LMRRPQERSVIAVFREFSVVLRLFCAMIASELVFTYRAMLISLMAGGL
jgi:hypothetical protein